MQDVCTKIGLKVRVKIMREQFLPDVLKLIENGGVNGDTIREMFDV